MVSLTIDGRLISVAEGTTIMEAAGSAGIHIPHLCYLKGINEISACKVCMVEIEGKQKLVTACSTPVAEGMVVYTNSPRARQIRRTNVELILSQHDCKCAICVRSGNCSLQTLAGHLGIYEIPFKEQVTDIEWNQDYPIIRDSKKCIKCMRCVQICDKVQGIGVWNIQNTGAYTTINTVDNKSIECTDCTMCGQCITHCPVGALKERNDSPQVYNVLADPQKVTVIQIAPAVRTAWLERMDMPEGIDSEGRLVAALKKVGFDYVLDTTFAADVTIMEEGSELLRKLSEKKDERLPMFTSCCPGWVNYATKRHPELLPYISTTKSPQQIFGALIKTYFAEKKGIDPKDIYMISVMPCVAKKGEAENFDMRSNGIPDVDLVLTTRELVKLLRAERINPVPLKEESFDSPIGEGTGAGVIFGVTGGVMEAALRTAYAITTGEEIEPDAFKEIRNADEELFPDASAHSGVILERDAVVEDSAQYTPCKEIEVSLNGKTVRACVVSGLGNAEKLISQIKKGSVHYDFVEVMACPGGCVSGGGQPIHDGEEWGYRRGTKLYDLDKNRQLRRSHENPDVQKLYEEFLKEPLSERAEELLHINHTS